MLELRGAVTVVVNLGLRVGAEVQSVVDPRYGNVEGDDGAPNERCCRNGYEENRSEEEERAADEDCRGDEGSSEGDEEAGNGERGEDSERKRGECCLGREE